MPAAPPVSFLVSRFPNPSETFIQAQAEGLMERGCTVEIVALAQGDAGALKPLLKRWPETLKVSYAPLPKTFGARVAAAFAPLARPGALKTLDGARFGDDATSLRLLIASARWPKQAPGKRVWLAHYGRWGRFACALRDLGFIDGPVATVFHGKDMSAYLDKHPNAYESLLKRGDLFLPISELWCDRLLQLGAPAGRTMIQRMGVDTSRFAMTPRTLESGAPVRFVGVGRLVEKKGFDDALAAFAQFCASPNAPAATLTLIGGGPLAQRLHAQATALGLRDAVRFTGLMAHAKVAEELAAAHVFVLPSKTAKSGDMEGIPVALMEAMAQGLPVLATRHSGTPELVQHEVSGLLCEEGAWRELAANMGKLARAPERWAAMGAAGSAKVRADFDLKKWNDTLRDRLALLYGSVTNPLPHANTPP